MQRPTNKIPSVIPRRDIPLARTSDDDGRLEVRPFTAHRILSGVFPAQSSVSLAWTQARPGKDVALRCHSTRGLLIILEGRAVLLGGPGRNVEAGDVITLPALQQYGFTAIGPDGLHALHVSFDSDSTSHTDVAQTLAQLLRKNDARLQTTLNNEFFSLLRGSSLDSARKVDALHPALRTLSEAFAAVRSDGSMLGVYGAEPCHSGPLDAGELAVADLVFETCKHYLARLSTAPLTGMLALRADAAERRLASLAALDSSTYVRLLRVLDGSWDMVDAITQPLARQIAAKLSS